jgi:hypothetical protein
MLIFNIKSIEMETNKKGIIRQIIPDIPYNLLYVEEWTANYLYNFLKKLFPYAEEKYILMPLKEAQETQKINITSLLCLNPKHAPIIKGTYILQKKDMTFLILSETDIQKIFNIKKQER